VTSRLAVCCAPQFLIAFDFSVMTVAIAPLTADLEPPGQGPALVLAAYALPFGSLLIGSGRVVDRVGPRRCLLAGLALFAAGAVFAASAHVAEALLAGRALQGAGAALTAPAGLALTAALFPSPGARRRALSWYAASISAGFVLGALTAGVATELRGWRVAVAQPGLVALIALVAARALSAHAGHARRTGGRGGPAIVATLAALAGSFALCALSSGSAPAGVVSASAGLALVLAATAAARRTGPPGPLVRDRRFRQTVVAGALVTATGVTGTIVLSLHLQGELGYSPVQTGALFTGFGAGTLAGRRLAVALGGTRRVLAAGLGLQGLALASAAVAVGGRPAWPVLLTLVAAFGFGHVIANAGVAMGTAAVPAGFHGIAAAVVGSAQYVSGAIGPLVVLSAGGDAAQLGLTGLTALAAALGLAWLATGTERSLRRRGTKPPVVRPERQ
jgi:MFS family permease